MNNRGASMLAGFGLLLLVGCGPAGPELATSVEEVAGIWTSTDPSNTGTFIYHADGSLTCGSTLLMAEGDSSNCDGMIWFEGTEQHVVDNKLCADAEGVYEIQLLDNGNIKHIPIEDDECQARLDFLTGVNREGVEMAPVVQ